MSNYQALARHPFTGKIEMADWLDDSFGHHIYGVRFPGDATIYRHTSDTEVSLHEAGVEIERLRAELTDARAAAIEEAATVIRNYVPCSTGGQTTTLVERPEGDKSGLAYLTAIRARAALKGERAND